MRASYDRIRQLKNRRTHGTERPCACGIKYIN